ncbi:MAG: histidine phosphatase family protein [Eubacterium sp.]|nr:histidine phosphatase family protein [Eubacterium sp.]
MMKELFLIRHGRQDSKLCNVDVELSTEGREQARLAGERLRNYGIEKVYTSELLRARETGQIIADILSLPVEALPDIEEIHFGGFTGKTDEQIRSLYGAFQKERRKHEADIPFPVGGECGADVVRRAMPVIRDVCSRAENRVVIATHGGVIRSICAAILGADQKDKLKFGIDIENGSLTELIYDPERDFFFLERFNDFAHLEGHPELLRKGWKTSLERGV